MSLRSISFPSKDGLPSTTITRKSIIFEETSSNICCIKDELKISLISFMCFFHIKILKDSYQLNVNMTSPFTILF